MPCSLQDSLHDTLMLLQHCMSQLHEDNQQVWLVYALWVINAHAGKTASILAFYWCMHMTEHPGQLSLCVCRRLTICTGWCGCLSTFSWRPYRRCLLFILFFLLNTLAALLSATPDWEEVLRFTVTATAAACLQNSTILVYNTP